MAIYMKFGSVDGSVTTKGFEKWIELGSCQLGVSRNVTTAARGSMNREASEPSFSEVVVTKTQDTSSVKLMEDAWGGDLNTKVVIKFTTTVKNGVNTFLTYELEKCGVSSFSFSSHSEGNPMESLSLNFTKITVAHTGMDAKVGGSPVRVSYDLEQMKAG